MGGSNGPVLGDVEILDVNGALVETLPNLRKPRYKIYLITIKESPNLIKYQTLCRSNVNQP